MSIQDSSPPALFSDNLFNTTLFPQVTVAGANKKTEYANTSINGIDWPYSDPELQQAFINNLNSEIGRVIYGNSSGFNCLVDVISYPVRYVVMHSTGSQNAKAHELIVFSPTVTTYIDTDWRIPPNYTQGGL
jgi:hypothetical protein